MSTPEKEPGPMGTTPDAPVPEEKRVRQYKDFGHEEEKPTHANVDMSMIESKAEDLYDKEKVNLETIVIDNVFKLLQCTEDGLAPEDVIRRLDLFSPNRLEQEDQNPFLQYLSFTWNPLSWVMEAATLVAIALSNGHHRAPDFVGIVSLLFANSAIGFCKERNAGNAVKALTDLLAPKPKIGDIVPTDCRLTEAINISIDKTALTGESLPQSKKAGDRCFSVVIATGANTLFGHAAYLVGQDDDPTGHLKKILTQIGSFCLIIISLLVSSSSLRYSVSTLVSATRDVQPWSQQHPRPLDW